MGLGRAGAHLRLRWDQWLEYVFVDQRGQSFVRQHAQLCVER
jgi:hypothetical protein